MSQIELRRWGVSDREVLRTLTNSWLYMHERDDALELALTGTDDECHTRVTDLEIKCNERLNQWRQFQ